MQSIYSWKVFFYTVKIKAIFLRGICIVFLLILTTNVMSSYGLEAEIAVADAQCFQFSIEECASVVKGGNKEFDCSWNNDLNKCRVNNSSAQLYRSELEYGLFDDRLGMFGFLSIILVVVSLIVFKFGKSEVLKKVFGVKLVAGILTYSFIILFPARFDFIGPNLILSTLLLLVILTMFSILNIEIRLPKEQNKLKIAIIILFLVELIEGLFFLVYLGG